MKMPIYLHPLSDGDYPKLIKLWTACQAIDMRKIDTPATFSGFLQRNPLCNFAAYAGTRLVGAVLAGHDGRRGYLYRMAVKPDYRERGIGAQLVRAAVGALKRQGVHTVHCLVSKENLVAQQFWEACGFEQREELLDYSLQINSLIS